MNFATTQQRAPQGWQAKRGRIDNARASIPRSADPSITLDAFRPLVEARTQYEMGCAAWACGHAPSAKVAADDLAFDTDEIEGDDARLIVTICLRDFAKPTPLIVDSIRAKLMGLGGWFDRDAAPNPDTLHLRQWSEAKLCRLFQPRARTIADLGIARTDLYLDVVGEGFAANVRLLRQVAADEKRSRDAMRFVRDNAATERRASP
jgi:hypothetical protein